MRLSNQTNNAVKVLVHCAQAGGRTLTVPEIAASCGITEFNVFKLVPLLVKAGLLETIRGRSGGVRLNLAPEDISLGAVVRATESVFRDPGSSHDETDGEAGTGADYIQMIDGAFLAFVEFLDQKSIAELADLDRKPAEATSPQTGGTGASAKAGLPK